MAKPGVLLIHGFTSHRASMAALLPELDRLGLQYDYRMLSGHGTTPKDLTHVRWVNWQHDVEAGYRRLREHHDQVVVIALSMGAVLAIELAAHHPDHVAGLVLLSPAVMFKNPLSPFTPLVSKILPRYPFPVNDAFSSKKYADRCQGYRWFPTKSYASFWQRTKTIWDDVPQVKCPVRIIQSQADKIADPRGAQRLYDALPGRKELLWHDVSGHEILLDAETPEVVKEVLDFPPLVNS